MPAGAFHFSVQAIDNAYNAGAQCVGSAAPCAEVKIENLSACTNEVVPLVAASPVYWFSFSEGFLGISDHYEMEAALQDTVFYYDPQKPGCDGLNAWTVQVNDDTTRVEISERVACEEDEIQLSVEEGWSNIEWSSHLKGNLGNENSINYTVSQPDTIFTDLTNPAGCSLLRKTAVRISKPSLVLAGDSYKIAKGSSVQLQVSGAATYTWKPVAGLDNANIANPVASPLSSIQYTVTGYDSLGCEGEATVNILVEAEGAGFIPNLFTPNDDGTNDQLKIYGLPPVKEFSFSIFNREGVMVFKTTNVLEASQSGWDGTKNGSKQPAGVYFWKVSGESTAGRTILLNGKDSGSIVLVR
jgi:gliding motility-associated-like protein